MLFIIYDKVFLRQLILNSEKLSHYLKNDTMSGQFFFWICLIPTTKLQTCLQPSTKAIGHPSTRTLRLVIMSLMTPLKMRTI